MKDLFRKLTSIIAIILLSIIMLLSAYMLYFNVFSVEYPVYNNFFNQPYLYILIATVFLLIYLAVTFGEKRIIKTITLILLILNLNPFSLLFFALFGTRISATQDVANYGNYESYADKIEEIMPKEITDDMVPVTYSYYCDMSWDTVLEVYLEVKMTDSAYGALKEQYGDSLQVFEYAEGYEEFVLSYDYYAFEESTDYNIYTDRAYISGPDIRKIIFCDKENTVIFVAMVGADPFYIENSKFFERFGLERP